MSKLTRREFLKSIGVVATAITIPVSIEVATKPFLELQKVHKNYLVLQASQKLVVAEVRAFDLDMAKRHRILPVVFEETFDIRKLNAFASLPSRLELDFFNGVPLRFEGAGAISLIYRSQDGNCIDINLDDFRCLTGERNDRKSSQNPL